MKVKVVKEFIDKHEKKLHKVNEVFECEKERFAEIKKTGNFVEEVKEETKKQ